MKRIRSILPAAGVLTALLYAGHVSAGVVTVNIKSSGALSPEDTVVTEGAVFLSNKLALGEAG